MRLFEMLIFIIRIIWILPNIWLMIICFKRFVLIVNGWLLVNIMWQSLRRYDTIKTCPWNFFKFSWVVHYRKICKNQIKNRGSPCYFMAFLAQKLIYTINIWFNFVLGLFFKQDHLLNLIILGGYSKRWPKCARISKQKLM